MIKGDCTPNYLMRMFLSIPLMAWMRIRNYRRRLGPRTTLRLTMGRLRLRCLIKGVSNELGAETENGVPASEVPGVGEHYWPLNTETGQPEFGGEEITGAGVGNELEEGGAGEVPGVGEQDWVLDAKVGRYAARLHGLADNPRLEHYWPSAHGLDDTSQFEKEWLVIHPEKEVEGLLERNGWRRSR